MKKRFMKQFLSMFLAVLMVFGSIPMDAFATESGGEIVVSDEGTPDAQSEDVPFGVTVDGKDITDIKESGTLVWEDMYSGTSTEVTYYTVTVPQGSIEATLTFKEEKECCYYTSSGSYIGNIGGGYEMAPAASEQTVAIQNSNGDGELDGISVQIPKEYSTEYFILFVYAAGESCIKIKEGAPTTAKVSSGGLYELNLQTVFEDNKGHNLVKYSYVIDSTVENEHTKIVDGKFYFTAQEMKAYKVTLTAKCEDGETAEHNLIITVKEANQGIPAQYGYDETAKSSVKVYVTLSNDGLPLLGADGTKLANLEVTVPYFDLSLYGLQGYYRYGTTDGKGPYTNKTVIERPTGLHLYIYLLERYYIGLDEKNCCIGYDANKNKIADVLEYKVAKDVLYMDGSKAYNSNDNGSPKEALKYSGGATSIFMNYFWGHDCNLMYYRNHCYPYMSPGWGSTSDYILLSDGDAIDVALYTDWGFYHSGYFASFNQDCYKVNGGSSLTVSTRKWGTTFEAENFEDVNGSEKLVVELYNSKWNKIQELNYNADNSNKITITVPETDGIYYLMASDPNRKDPKEAKVAPAVARIVVGDAGESGGAVDITKYYENYDFISIKDDHNRYLVDITASTIDASSNSESENLPVHQVIVGEGTENVYVTFPSGKTLGSYIAIYNTEDGSSDYDMSFTLNLFENEDGTITVEIPASEYTDNEQGIIIQSSSNKWLYGFDFVTGKITEITVGTSVSRILFDTYAETLTIKDGVKGSVQIKPTVIPAEATGWTIEWTSSNESVATVDQTGKVTAVAEGTAVITAAIGDVKNTCAITVERYNTAPKVVSDAATRAKIKTNETHTLDVSKMFTDEQNDTLTYTANLYKASGIEANDYVYNSLVETESIEIVNGICNALIKNIGAYALKITADDGRATTTHTYRLTVVNNDAGTVKLNDGVTIDFYNAVVVESNEEFVEDYEIEYKGTHDTTIHHIVLSKDVINGHKKMDFIIQDGYLWGQYSTSFNTDKSWATNGNVGLFAKDTQGNVTAHYLMFHTECKTHKDDDKNMVCDSCTMKLPSGGQFALMAVNKDGFIIEPCYVSYAEGATLKEALKASEYDFKGIEQNYISEIAGVAGNYSFYYDNGNCLLNTPASEITGVWFASDSNQGYNEDLLNLTKQMAAYNASTNGLKTYEAAKTAYETAIKEFYQTSNAAKLYTNLKTAMDNYNAFMDGEQIALNMNITKDGHKLISGKAVFKSEFGTTLEVTNLSKIDIKPGIYSFDISDGGFCHVRGTVEVKSGATLNAELPKGDWLESLNLSINGGDKWTAVKKGNVTVGSATYFVPDYANSSLYPYAVCAKNEETHKLYEAGSETARVWESKNTTLAYVIEQNSLSGKELVMEIRHTDDNGFEQYQTYTMDIQRVPSLKALSVSDAGTALKIDFDKKVMEYTVSAVSGSVDVVPTALCNDATIKVAGTVVENGKSVNVALDDSIKENNIYKIPVVVTAPNKQSVTYTIKVEKEEAVQVTLVAPNAEVSVQLLNDAGSEIQASKIEGVNHIYNVIPNTEYTYIVTANGCYHASAKFIPTEAQPITLAPPKAVDWIDNLSLKAGNTDAAPAYEMVPAFADSEHNYETTVESNSTAFYLKTYANDTSNYKTEIIFKTHNNTAYSEYSENRREECHTIINQDYNYVTNFLGDGGWGNDMLIRITQNAVENGVTYYQDYNISVHREMTLYAMSARDNNGDELILNPQFKKLTNAYTTTIGATAESMSVAFKAVNSSTAYDYDQYEITVACDGETVKTITYAEASKLKEEQNVEVPLTGDETAQTVTVTVSHKATGAVANTYSIALTKLPAVDTTITVEPMYATVFLTEEISGGRVYPEADGTYSLKSGVSYKYVVTKYGYVSQTATFVANEENANISVTLAKAADSTLGGIAIDGDWLQFRADNNNNGVVNVKTPTKAEDTVLEWANQIGTGYDSGATGCPIIVGGYIYTYAGNSIVKVNKDTGEVVDSGVMAASSSFAINSPTYAEGMIFVGLSDGRVQAFNAETLKSLWLFTDPLGGQPNCPIVYHDGYIYTGFWNSETSKANFVCISVTDEDQAQTDETKLSTWAYTHNGFYWAGAYVNDNFVLVGTDDGDSGYTNGYASILSLNPKTGVLLDEMELTNVGDQRSSICYDEATKAYYFTTKGGDFYKMEVNADGTIVENENSLRRLHLDNGANMPENPPMSTSTPVIHNGRAYIGVSGTSQFGAYSGHNMTVIDLETFSIAYRVPTQGYPQVSGLLTTAYENTDGYAYVYFIDNYTPGKIRVIRDKAGMTAVDPKYVTVESYQEKGETKTITAGYVLFTPSGAEAQYAICSPIVDSEGNLYFKNDSARMMKLSSRITSLEITEQPEKLAYEAGMKFDGTGLKVTAHYANGVSKDITNYISYTTDALKADDTEITVSFDPDKMLVNEETKEGGFWRWYQDYNGVVGEKYYLPTATVNISISNGHQMTKTEASDATCTEPGNVEYYTCSVCKKNFADEAGKTELKDVVIPALGHTMTATAYKAATCTEAGNEHYFACGTCQKKFADEGGETELTDVVIPALGHTMTETNHQAATCTEAGNEHYFACGTCQKNFADEYGMTELTAIIIPKLGHKMTEVESSAPSCTGTGNVKYYHCANCEKNFADRAGTNELKDVNTEALGHKLNEVKAKSPTCTEDGNIEYFACSACKKNYADADATIEITGSVVRAALGHTMKETAYKAATCTEDGNKHYYACDTCKKNFADKDGETEMKDVVIPAAHDLKKEDEVKATCTEDGQVSHYHCAACQKNFADAAGTQELTSVTIPADHGGMRRTAYKAATCTKAGNVEYYTCSVCKKHFEDRKGENLITNVVIPASHGTMTHTAAKAATCAEAGNVEYDTCSVCQKNFEDATAAKELTNVVIKALGHQMTKKASTAASCTGKGNVEYYHCDTCQKNFADKAGTKEMIDVETSAVGHKLCEVKAKAPTCTTAGNVAYYHCDACNKNFGDLQCTTELTNVVVIATGHSMGVKTEKVEPTCTTDGKVAYYTCGNCSGYFADAEGKQALDTIVIPRAHKIAAVQGKEPKVGEEGIAPHYECSSCHDKFADEKGTKPVDVDKVKLPALVPVKSEPIKEVPEDLAVDFRDAAEIKDEIERRVEEIVDVSADTKIETVHFEFNLQSENDMPDDKMITIRWKYKDIGSGSGKDKDFIVTHMYKDANGDVTVEFPEVFKDDEGIWFVVKGLSPISVSWVEKVKVDNPTPPSGGSGKDDSSDSDKSNTSNVTEVIAPAPVEIAKAEEQKAPAAEVKKEKAEEVIEEQMTTDEEPEVTLEEDLDKEDAEEEKGAIEETVEETEEFSFPMIPIIVVAIGGIAAAGAFIFKKKFED